MSSAREEAVFDLQSVTVTYGDAKKAGAALQDLSLVIHPGEKVAFIGPSGSGKTTLLRACCAAVEPAAGAVFYRGRNLGQITERELRSLRGRIGFVHQDFSLIANLRVLHNVLLGRLAERSLLGAVRSLLLPRRAAVSEIYDLLQRVGIAEKLYSRTDRLSGGQQQRVAIARALYQRPDVLLADEPISSLDPARAEDLLRLIIDLASEDNLTLAMSIHNVALARKYFPRLVGLRSGRITFDRPAAEVSDESIRELFTLEQYELSD